MLGTSHFINTNNLTDEQTKIKEEEMSVGKINEVSNALDLGDKK